MPTVDHNPILNFDRGIEGILAGLPTEVKLPEVAILTPWDGQIEERVQQFLNSPSHEDQLCQTLAPEHLDPALLRPDVFRDKLRRCTRQIKKEAQENPELADAAEVLEDLQVAEEYLEAYRNSLRQA